VLLPIYTGALSNHIHSNSSKKGFGDCGQDPAVDGLMRAYACFNIKMNSCDQAAKKFQKDTRIIISFSWF
jgi:hypothetical protein